MSFNFRASFFLLIFCVSCSHLSLSKKSSSVIFFHPDGMSLSHWDIGRLITEGPDGETSFDKMPHIAIYKPHIKESLVATSNAGATIHAYGFKVHLQDFGIKGNKSSLTKNNLPKSHRSEKSPTKNHLYKNNLSKSNLPKNHQSQSGFLKDGLSKNHQSQSDLSHNAFTQAVSHQKGNKAQNSLFEGDRFKNRLAKSHPTKSKNQNQRVSILKEAQQKGFKTGLVQSGHLTEPGTAVFASSAKNRRAFHTITEQLIHSDIDILLGAGEKYLLPKGVKGRFGRGVRTDKKNLIQEAQAQGYLVIYTLQELKKIPKTARKVLGVFAYNNTYNDETEEVLIQKGLKAYEEQAPSIAEMSKYALEFLTRDKSRFFMVIEEEGTDNFSNKNNAEALLIAIKRSLKALDFLRAFLKKNKNTLLLVASDSNASSPALIAHFSATKPFSKDQVLPHKTKNGSPLDKKRNGLPFLAKPDKTGLEMPFAIAWPTKRDTRTGVVVKAEGYQAHKVKGTLDNTELYHIMRQTLFE